MAVPTGDERREVAEKLRDEANGFRRNRAYGVRTEIDLGDVPGVFQDITHFCGLHGMVRCDDMLDLLADLIDPTCEVDGVTATDCDTYVFALSCGHEVEWPWREGFAYCPECGFRVVGGDVR